MLYLPGRGSEHERRDRLAEPVVGKRARAASAAHRRPSERSAAPPGGDLERHDPAEPRHPQVLAGEHCNGWNTLSLKAKNNRLRPFLRI